MSKFSSIPRGVWHVGFITLALSLVLCAILLVNSDGDPLTFAWIGTKFAERDPLGTVGYDGQFAYYIARDGAAAVPYIDGPSLRYQRILYPLLSRALAFGQTDLVPWTLILVNVAAHSIGAALMAFLLTQHGVSPYWGMIYGLWLGALYGIRFNLNEPLCFMLALLAVLAYQREKYLLAIFLLMLSTMTKELGMIFAFGMALHAFMRGKWRWSILIIGGPLLLFLVWWLIMRLWFGTLPTIYPAAKFHLLPFYGLFTVSSVPEFVMLFLWLALPALFLLALALRTLRRTHKITLELALFAPGLVFLLGMPDVSWQDPVAAYRVGMPLLITGLLFAAKHYPHSVRWLGALWLPSALVFIGLVGLLVP